VSGISSVGIEGIVVFDIPRHITAVQSWYSCPVVYPLANPEIYEKWQLKAFIGNPVADTTGEIGHIAAYHFPVKTIDGIVPVDILHLDLAGFKEWTTRIILCNPYGIFRCILQDAVVHVIIVWADGIADEQIVVDVIDIITVNLDNFFPVKWKSEIGLPPETTRIAYINSVQGDFKAFIVNFAYIGAGYGIPGDGRQFAFQQQIMRIGIIKINGSGEKQNIKNRQGMQKNIKRIRAFSGRYSL